MKKIIKAVSCVVTFSFFACALLLAVLSLLRIMATASEFSLRLLAAALFLLLVFLFIRGLIACAGEVIARIRRRKAQ